MHQRTARGRDSGTQQQRPCGPAALTCPGRPAARRRSWWLSCRPQKSRTARPPGPPGSLRAGRHPGIRACVTTSADVAGGSHAMQGATAGVAARHPLALPGLPCPCSQYWVGCQGAGLSSSSASDLATFRRPLEDTSPCSAGTMSTPPSSALLRVRGTWWRGGRAAGAARRLQAAVTHCRQRRQPIRPAEPPLPDLGVRGVGLGAPQQCGGARGQRRGLRACARQGSVAVGGQAWAPQGCPGQGTMAVEAAATAHCPVATRTMLVPDIRA